MRALVFVLVALAGCASEPHARIAAGEAPTEPAPTPSSAPAPKATPKASGGTPEPAPPAPQLPPDLELGTPVTLPVPGSRPLRVIHAPAQRTRALVYLHGVCGDVTAVDSWSGAATRHGTLIELVGDTRCKGSTRYRWTSSTEVLAGRIADALAAVRAARGGLLDTERVVLIGYSQGAIRAEALAKHYPERFDRLLLAGVPVTPAAASFRGVVAVALVGGEREGLAHLRAGQEALRAAGRPVKSFILPGAGHGEFGPDADRVMGQALDWLLER